MSFCIGGQQRRDLWAVTAYFNPCAYTRRRENYKVFAERLQLPLLTVELAYGANYELTSADATELVQIRGQHVMWQKERLINHALQYLPHECRKVVWLDCDLLFEGGDWALSVSRALEHSVLLQPFDRVYALDKDVDLTLPLDGQAFLVRQSMMAWYLSEGSEKAAATDSEGDLRRHGLSRDYAAGHAWAMRREALERVGLYDALVVGGGDYALAQAAVGDFESTVRSFRMSASHALHYREWAAQFHSLVGGRVGMIAGAVFHLWHGQLADREYVPRHSILASCDFDPRTDIQLDQSGCWRWSSAKGNHLSDEVARYFARRREDGKANQ